MTFLLGLGIGLGVGYVFGMLVMAFVRVRKVERLLEQAYQKGLNQGVRDGWTGHE
jgi:hypothetical protein